MLELNGRKYLVDYCAVMYNKSTRELLYKAYVTECLRIRLNIEVSYLDLIFPKKDVEDERTAEEIKQSFIDRLGRTEQTV